MSPLVKNLGHVHPLLFETFYHISTTVSLRFSRIDDHATHCLHILSAGLTWNVCQHVLLLVIIDQSVHTFASELFSFPGNLPQFAVCTGRVYWPLEKYVLLPASPL